MARPAVTLKWFGRSGSDVARRRGRRRLGLVAFCTQLGSLWPKKVRFTLA